MTRFVGLDVSQKVTAICDVDDAGRRLWRGQCPTIPEQISILVRQIDSGPVFEPIQTSERPNFRQKAPFVKSDGPRTAASRGFGARSAAQLSGQNVKSAGVRVSSAPKSRASGACHQMAAGDTTVGSRPSGDDCRCAQESLRKTVSD
jgi:hypothetical protein